MSRDLFRFDAPAVADTWSAVNDGVMGGVSSGRLRAAPDGHAVFEGTVSFENNGGFASVRSPVGDHGAPGAMAYVLVVRGDGKRYRLTLRTDDAFDGIAYHATFVAAPEAWRQARLPVASFEPTFRGRVVPGAPPLDPARVRQVGLMIADKQAGPFALHLQSIAAE